MVTVGVRTDNGFVFVSYVYRALSNGNYSMGATVGFVQSVVGLLLVLGANLVVKKISPE